VPNSVLRVISDNQGALCHLTLQYVDWLALQLLPDTAETEWLDRHGQIWLKNADGTLGKKQATLASGTVTATGINGSIIPAGSLLGQSSLTAGYQTTSQVVVGNGPTEVPARALNAGLVGNLQPEDTLAFTTPPPGVDSQVTVIQMDGGTNTETDEQLRMRVLQRIRQPPMGGATNDYIGWALAVPGVTRAWCIPLEMGIGTVTVRFMMDDLRAADDGFPTFGDVEVVRQYIDTVRPVAVKDFFVESPIKQAVDVDLTDLNPNTEDVRAEIELSLRNMLFVKASPGQTIYAAWKSYAVMSAPGVLSFRMTNELDDVMQSPGHMAVLGDIVYGP
jgi:uncharacterized phage protein gp47/JayE